MHGGAVKQLGNDAQHAVNGVADGARLLEDFLLHVVAVGAEFGRAAVRVHGAHRALLGAQRLARLVEQPVAAALQIDQVALLQIDDLVGHAGQRHRIAGNEMLAALAYAQDQRRAGARADQAFGFVLVHHGQRIGAVQLGDGRAEGVKQVAVVEAVDQMGDDLGVGLADKHIALGLQAGAQRFVVLDDAVVHQRHARRLARLDFARAEAEMRVGVAHRGFAMGCPAGVGNAGEALQVFGLHLLEQLGHAGRAARALQSGAAHAGRIQRMHGDAAGVIAAVLEPLQALHQHGNDVAMGNGADNATHKECS